MFAMKRIRLAVAALAAIALGGGAGALATAASASPAHHYPPVSLNRLNLSGFVVNAKYTLGTNTGNTFQQVYGNGTVQGTPIAGPNVGVKFPVEDYVAVPIGDDQVYITWQDPKTLAIVDVFVMNLKTHTVYDYAPGTAKPESAGYITVKHWPTHGLPRLPANQGQQKAAVLAPRNYAERVVVSPGTPPILLARATPSCGGGVAPSPLQRRVTSRVAPADAFAITMPKLASKLTPRRISTSSGRCAIDWKPASTSEAAAVTEPSASRRETAASATDLPARPARSIRAAGSWVSTSTTPPSPSVNLVSSSAILCLLSRRLGGQPAAGLPQVNAGSDWNAFFGW